jgi:hypothetical protein
MVKNPNTTNAASAKSPAAKVSGKSRSDHRWFLPVLVELKLIFPQKFPENVGALANRHPRICDTWKARRGAPDGEAMASLLNSVHGDRLWLALTNASPHAWRKRLDRQLEIGRLLEQQRDTARRIKALEQGES